MVNSPHVPLAHGVGPRCCVAVAPFAGVASADSTNEAWAKMTSSLAAEQAECVQHEVGRSAIYEAVEGVWQDGAAVQSSVAGQNAADAVACWAAQESHRLAVVSKALHHWAGWVLRMAFHNWLSRTDPTRERSAAVGARQAVAAGGFLDGWMHDDEAVLERPSVAMLDGPGHYVRVGYLPEHAHLAGARLHGRAQAILRGVNDGPLPLGRQHEGRLHTLVPPPHAFPANGGLGGLPGPWEVPYWAMQPEHGLHYAHNAWGMPIEQYPVGQVNPVPQAVPVAQPPPAPVPAPAPEQPEPARTLLGNGWEERHTAEGRPYYAHHPTRTTQFEKPSPEELGQVVKVVDPLANLRAIREQKIRLQMRAEDLRLQAEMQRQESLAKAVGTHLAAADDALRQRAAVTGYTGYDEVLGVGSSREPAATPRPEDKHVHLERSRSRPGLAANAAVQSHEEQENIVPRRRSDADISLGTQAQPDERGQGIGGSVRGSGEIARARRTPLSPLDDSTVPAGRSHTADDTRSATSGPRPPGRVFSRYVHRGPARNTRPVSKSTVFPEDLLLNRISRLFASHDHAFSVFSAHAHSWLPDCVVAGRSDC